MLQGYVGVPLDCSNFPPDFQKNCQNVVKNHQFVRSLGTIWLHNLHRMLENGQFADVPSTTNYCNQAKSVYLGRTIPTNSYEPVLRCCHQFCRDWILLKSGNFREFRLIGATSCSITGSLSLTYLFEGSHATFMLSFSVRICMQPPYNSVLCNNYWSIFTIPGDAITSGITLAPTCFH